MEGRDRPRRQQQRVQLAGTIRLLIDTPDGVITANGQIIDLSEGGCALRLYRHVDAQQVGRVLVQVAGREVWVPVVIRWARADPHGWRVGCEFDRPTAEKQQVIRGSYWSDTG